MFSHGSPKRALEGSTGWRTTTVWRIFLWLWVPGAGENPLYLPWNSSSPQYHSISVCKTCGRKGEWTVPEISEAAGACSNHGIIKSGRDLRRSWMQVLHKQVSNNLWWAFSAQFSSSMLHAFQEVINSLFPHKSSMNFVSSSLEKQGPLVAAHLATMWDQKSPGAKSSSWSAVPGEAKS